MSKFRYFPLLLLAALVLYAVLVPLLNPVAVHRVDLAAIYLPPGAEHLFGTDQLGRDIWVRAAQGMRLSLLLAACSAAASTLIGVGVGVAAAYAGGWVDRVAMRLIDAINAVPHLLLSVVVLAMWPGLWWAIVATIALTHWTQVARIVRSRLVAERESGYVALSKAAGARPAAIWFTHLIPAVAPQAGIALVLQLPHAIWHESALSFLGVGLPPQAASLGLLLEDARGGVLAGAWWLLLFPAGLLVAVSWAVATLGHRAPVRAPRTARRHRKQHPKPDQSRAAEAEGLRVEQLSVWKPASSGKDRVELLHGLDYRALPGAINVIIGPSGAGKTMLLRTIAGLLPETLQYSGQIVLGGQARGVKSLAQARGRELVLVPGSAATALNPVRTVGTALSREHRRFARDSSPQALAAAVRRLHLPEQLLQRYPHELSGGQAQRMVLALGLVGGAHTILLDEPTSALDPESSLGIEKVLHELAEAGHTIIMVTHDLELARRLGDQVAVLDSGRITNHGPVTENLAEQLETARAGGQQ